jgi:hypothetical protein
MIGKPRLLRLLSRLRRYKPKNPFLTIFTAVYFYRHSVPAPVSAGWIKVFCL